MEFNDVLGRKVILREYPRSIVSLVPSITETLFAFDLHEKVIGITEYCTYPKEGVAAKVRLGGTKTLKLDDIISLNPDLVLANIEENKKSQIEWLIDKGFNVYLTFPKTVKNALETMLELGRLTGSHSRAEGIIKPIQEVYERFKNRPIKRRQRVLCLIWKHPYMSFNSDTFVNDMIDLAGGENVFANRNQRYFRFQLKEIQSLSPDIILLPSEPYRFGEKDIGDFQDLIHPAKVEPIYLIDGELITWHGPRLAQGLEILSRIFSRSLA